MFSPGLGELANTAQLSGAYPIHHLFARTENHKPLISLNSFSVRL